MYSTLQSASTCLIFFLLHIYLYGTVYYTRWANTCVPRTVYNRGKSGVRRNLVVALNVQWTSFTAKSEFQMMTTEHSPWDQNGLCLEVNLAVQGKKSQQESKNLTHSFWPHLDDEDNAFHVRVVQVILNIEVTLRLIHTASKTSTQKPFWSHEGGEHSKIIPWFWDPSHPHWFVLYINKMEKQQMIKF